MSVTAQDAGNAGATHREKIALLAAVVMRPGNWDEEAAAWSKLLPHDYPGDHAQAFAEMVKTGALIVMDLVLEGLRVGIVLLEIDHDFEQPEMIVHAAICADTRRDATADCLGSIEAQAKALGCATVRFHTMRPGLITKTMRAGFHISEVILRKSIL